MSQIIKFRIKPNGTFRVDTVCNGGANCESLTANLERRMGKVDESSRAKTEDSYILDIEHQVENKL